MGRKKSKSLLHKGSERTIIFLTVLGLILTFLGVVAAWLVVPEFRDIINLEYNRSETALSKETEAAISIYAANENQTIPDLFPLFIGSKWEYQFGQVVEGEIVNGERTTKSALGSFSVTVTSAISGLSDRAKVLELKIEGENFSTYCVDAKLYSGELTVWYVMDNTRLFIACTKEEAGAIAADLVHEGKTEIQFPEFIAPLDLNVKWPEFDESDLLREDFAYVWYVESIVPVTVPAGTFTNCYRILLYTLPDTSVRYVCPGVGLVSSQYDHHGSRTTQTSELVDYYIP